MTGDLAYARGHFHPNKAPGTSLLAALPYFVIYRLERLFGANPDEWWTLTVNAWLTTVFSSGLISAFGCVLVFRLALAFSAGKTLPSLLTAIAFAFGTMFFPLATLLQDQNIAAVLLMASFYLLYRVKESGVQLANRLEHQGRSTALADRAERVLRGLCGDHQLCCRGGSGCPGCLSDLGRPPERWLEMVCARRGGAVVPDLCVQPRLLRGGLHDELSLRERGVPQWYRSEQGDARCPAMGCIAYHFVFAVSRIVF